MLCVTIDWYRYTLRSFAVPCVQLQHSIQRDSHVLLVCYRGVVCAGYCLLFRVLLWRYFTNYCYLGVPNSIPWVVGIADHAGILVRRVHFLPTTSGRIGLHYS